MLPWPDYWEGAACPTPTACATSSPPRCPASDWDPWRHRSAARWTTTGQGPRPDLLTGGRALIGRFLFGLQRFPNATVAGTELVDLIVNDGRVTGAVAPERKVGAHRRTPRVLLAAGGFEHNAEMRSGFRRSGRSVDSMGAPGNTGAAHPRRDGIRAADLMDQGLVVPA